MKPEKHFENAARLLKLIGKMFGKRLFGYTHFLWKADEKRQLFNLRKIFAKKIEYMANYTVLKRTSVDVYNLITFQEQNYIIVKLCKYFRQKFRGK